MQMPRLLGEALTRLHLRGTWASQAVPEVTGKVEKLRRLSERTPVLRPGL